MATVALPASVGAPRTISMGWSRRASHLRSMLVERFAVWHRVEERIDVWASFGALAVAGAATAVGAAVGLF